MMATYVPGRKKDDINEDKRFLKSSSLTIRANPRDPRANIFFLQSSSLFDGRYS
jgi:hypothetical protein